VRGLGRDLQIFVGERRIVNSWHDRRGQVLRAFDAVEGRVRFRWCRAWR
jgi:hypothetical protein